MGAQATRLSDMKIKAAKPKDRDYTLTDGNGLQLRVRTNGSRLWNFNYVGDVPRTRLGSSAKTHR